MSGIKTRKITLKDIPWIIDIQESIVQKKISRAWVKSIEAHLKKQDVIGFIAFRNGGVLGFIIGEIKGTGFGIGQSGWIVVIDVNPRYMGGGIGKALAEKLFEYF
ncbi:MAG: GNAT family N-acetyltransferase [Bacteroidia bacterium]|nr:GNAT family N-acetyltransferase [Bacteroidia bacterium]